MLQVVHAGPKLSGLTPQTFGQGQT